MGNQLVSSVKTVIKPIDYYLSEVPDFKLKKSLGQTQFLKVALCHRGSEGDVVVKVLSHEDPSLLLEPYREEILSFDKVTNSNASIASFRIAEIRPHFAYMVRQFVRFSLYDRLSTRPFLTDIEKCWIVYQVLRCMAWCHEKSIQHGDIKLENILVTSNLWVIMADFATYKPVSLAEDNPSFFNYFFDTSRRRCCNIAPERFVPTASLNQMDTNPTPHNSSTSLASLSQEAQLTDKMDMFSIGCILAEIFSDNNFLFDLSNLLYYKENKRDRLEQSLKKIESDVIRDLVVNLISLDPTQRKSSSQVLEEFSGVLFPSYFDKLYSVIRTLVRLPPDSKILYLAQELHCFLPAIVKENPNGILILLMTLTSTLQSLTHVHCKIEAQRLICHLVSSGAPTLSSYIIDRLIPYFANVLVKEPDHRVRGEAVHSITNLLGHVINIQPSDSNIFPDYLLDILIKSLESEKSVYVRLCMAQNVGRLSNIALNFLNQSCDQNYDEELNLLHTCFANLVVHLLTDSNNCVRRALLLTAENCVLLCTFFGRQKTNDVILPHIFTFLNHKNDFQLRLSFFDNIIVIASYLGVQCSTILHPLLQQGLCDAEEVIISKTINSVASLAEQGLLQKNVIYDLLKEILPLIYHPNQWITNSIVNLFTVLSEHLSVIDLHCTVLPMLLPYLSRHIHSLSNKYLVLDSLNPPIARNIFDIVMESKDSHVLFENLRNKNFTVNSLGYKRLLAEDIDSTVEYKLLALSDLLIKIHRNRRNYLANQNREEVGNQIELNDYDKLVRSVNLVDSYKDDDASSAANQEWQHMFGPQSKNLMDNNSGGVDGLIVGATEAKEIEYSYFECPPCGRDMRALILHKKSGFTPTTTVPATVISSSTPFKPKGFLVAHLYEHKSSVNMMARYGTTSCFLTCSDDGTIRFWDLANFESRHVISRSKYMFKMEFSNGSPINFKGIVSCGGYAIAYSNAGIIYVFEPSESAMALVCSFKPGQATKSTIPVLITSICALSSNIFAVSLTNSVIYGYDIRYTLSKNFFVPIFKVQISPNQRTITSIDGAEVVLFAATACGYIAGFDMRFNIKVNYFHQGQNNQSSRIAKIKYCSEGLYASSYGTTDITLWDYKIGHRDKVLRPRKGKDFLDKPSSVMHAILPVSCSTATTTASGVITGGSDFRIRYWDLAQPEQSYIVSDHVLRTCNYMGKVNPNNVNKSTSVHNLYFDHSENPPLLATFRGKRIGDHQVIEELDACAPYLSHSHFCTLDQQSPQSGHQDAITDLLRVNQYLVSSGRNGTVKVWR